MKNRTVSLKAGMLGGWEVIKHEKVNYSWPPSLPAS
jgi:hypothetical protein